MRPGNAQVRPKPMQISLYSHRRVLRFSFRLIKRLQETHTEVILVMKSQLCVYNKRINVQGYTFENHGRTRTPGQNYSVNKLIVIIILYMNHFLCTRL